VEFLSDNKIERIKMPPLCACGDCNGFVKWNFRYKCWNKFIHGHHAKGKLNGMYGVAGKDAPMYGRKRPDVTGDKNPMKRPEVLLKVIGPNNQNWQGGIACEPYCVNEIDHPPYRLYKEKLRPQKSNNTLL